MAISAIGGGSGMLPAAGGGFGNMFANPMFMGGLAMLLGGLQKKRQQTPLQDLMAGMGIASSMQGMQRQKDLYKLQQEEAERKAMQAEEQRQNLQDLMSGDPERIKKASIRMVPETFAKAQFPQPAKPTPAMVEAAALPTLPPEQAEYVRRARTTPQVQVGLTTGKPITAGEYRQESEILMSERMANRIEQLIDEGVDTGSKAAVKAAASASPWTSWAAGSVSDNEAEMYSLVENYSNLLLAAMRGAQVGPMEQAKFEKSLPRLGQSEKLFLANLKTTRDNINMLRKRSVGRREELGQEVEEAVRREQPTPTPDVPFTPPTPAASRWMTTPSGVKYRVVQ